MLGVSCKEDCPILDTPLRNLIDLLYNNDCVIVPEFGAFVLKSHSAYIKDDSFTPLEKSYLLM